MIKKCLISLFIIALSTITVFNTTAASVFTENGVTYTDTIERDIITRRAQIFSDYSLSSVWGTMTGHVGEYYYAEGGIENGWIDLKKFNGGRTLQITMPTFTQTGSATFRLQGRLGDSGDGFNIYDSILTAAGSEVIMIEENTDWFRLGVTINAIGTESFSVMLKANSGIPSK